MTFPDAIAEFNTAATAYSDAVGKKAGTLAVIQPAKDVAKQAIAAANASVALVQKNDDDAAALVTQTGTAFRKAQDDLLIAIQALMPASVVAPPPSSPGQI